MTCIPPVVAIETTTSNKLILHFPPHFLRFGPSKIYSQTTSLVLFDNFCNWQVLPVKRGKTGNR